MTKTARPSAVELAEAMAPIPEPSLPLAEAPAKIAVPTTWPETPAQVGERLKDAIRQEGAGDPPPRVVPSKRLTITELGGRVETIFLDAERGAYLTVERDEPVAATPWLVERVAGRYGLFSIESIVLEDVDEGS